MAQPYLGQGIQFPTKITQQGRVSLISGIHLVNQSIRIILNTPVGTSLGREHFGSQIRIALYEPNNRIAMTLLDYYISDALFKWEKRIRLVDILYRIDDNTPSTIYCEIRYRLKQASEINSFIFPFYRELNN